MIMTSIKRVVSTFILTGSKTREQLRIAVFHRVDTMPTYPGHWAACSGSIEATETPAQTAWRELGEETNLLESGVKELNKQHGLYVDVPFKKDENRETIIRVYPFTIDMPAKFSLELLGTEHDHWKFVSVSELEALQPAVPSLAKAFHHATAGSYLENVPESVRAWASDKSNGAAVMARNAIQLLQRESVDPEQMKMMRPSMVAITNAINSLQKSKSPQQVLDSLQREASRAVDYAVEAIVPLVKAKPKANVLRIAVFSRSSTLLAVLKRVMDSHPDGVDIVCSRSTPGNEGEQMAQDLGACCIDDDEMLNKLGEMDLLLVGSDCITEKEVINKIGTKALAQAAKDTPCQVFCCTDRYKLWEDIFPPPLEDIFEGTPIELFDKILLPKALNEAHCDAE